MFCAPAALCTDTLLKKQHGCLDQTGTGPCKLSHRAFQCDLRHQAAFCEEICTRPWCDLLCKTRPPWVRSFALVETLDLLQ